MLLITCVKYFKLKLCARE